MTRLKLLVTLTMCLLLALCTLDASAKDGEFTEKTYQRVELGMSLDEMVQTIGRNTKRVMPQAKHSVVAHYVATKYMQFGTVVPEGKYLMLVYQAKPRKKMFDMTPRILNAVIVLRDGVVVYKFSKEMNPARR